MVTGTAEDNVMLEVPITSVVTGVTTEVITVVSIDVERDADELAGSEELGGAEEVELVVEIVL